MYVCVCVCRRMKLSVEAIAVRSSAAEVLDGCKLPDVSAGNWPWILCKSSECSYLLSHLCMLFLTSYSYRKPKSQILRKLSKIFETVSRGVEIHSHHLSSELVLQLIELANSNSAFTLLLNWISSRCIQKWFPFLAISLQSGGKFGKSAERPTVVSNV